MIEKLKSIKNHQGFMKYFKNTSWLFGERILRMFLGVFVGIWVARYLGPEQFGLLSYAVSFVGLFTALATLGLDSIVIRELVKNEAKRDLLIGTAFWLKLFGAIVVLLVLVLVVSLTSNNQMTNTLIFIIASATIFQSFNVIDFYFQSKILSKYVVYSNVFSLLISSILKIILIISKAPLIAFAWVILFDALVLACGYIYFYSYKHLSFYRWKFHKETAILLLKDSWPLMFSWIFVSIFMKIDQVMIKEILGAESVGQYAAAVRLSEVWYFIPAVIVKSLFPAIINAKRQNKKLYFTRLQKLYDLMVWMAIIIALIVSFSSNWIIDLLYGKAYYEAGTVLTIHIWTGIFVFLGLAFGKYLTVENLTKKALYRTGFGALLNIIFNFLLIPKYGINGAAIATFIGNLVAHYIYDFFDKDLRIQLMMKTKSFFPIHILKGYK